MSNFQAIATVTAVLKELLQSTADVQGTTVKTSRPDSSAGNLSEPTIHLCLYQVTPNLALRNSDLPTRRSNGNVVQRPQVALDLHYLISFYGNEQDLIPQLLLGSAVRTLHAQPIILRERILSVIEKDAYAQLKGSNLADQVELVKFSSLSLSLEELSKIWSIFFQIPYALSIAYQGTVVLIEDDVSPQSSLPVRSANTYNFPFKQPLIDQVTQPGGAHLPILASSTLRITGKGFSKVNEIHIGDAVAQQNVASSVSDTQMTLPLARVAGLRAGVQGLQLFQAMPVSGPSVINSAGPVSRATVFPPVQSGVASNVVPLILRPTLASAPDVMLDAHAGDGEPRSGTITVTLTPDVGRQQRAMLLLNEVNPQKEQPAAYTFAATARETDGATLSFPFAQLLPAGYLVRVQIDGAESSLSVDTDPASSMYNYYAQPRITIV